MNEMCECGAIIMLGSDSLSSKNLGIKQYCPICRGLIKEK